MKNFTSEQKVTYFGLVVAGLIIVLALMVLNEVIQNPQNISLPVLRS